VRNTGDTYLDDITIDDADLGIDETQMTLLSGSTPLAPGASLAYYYEGTINGDLVNTAEVEGNPTDSGGNDLPGMGNPTDDDPAVVARLIPNPPDPGPPDPGPPAPAPPTPTPTFTPTLSIPISPTLTPTPTLGVLTVEKLPETGGSSGWFTIVLGISIIIGAVGLLNLALLEMGGRRGDGKGDWTA
jgi:LPXTG-motif cell wall-anchored protein